MAEDKTVEALEKLFNLIYSINIDKTKYDIFWYAISDQYLNNLLSFFINSPKLVFKVQIKTLKTFCEVANFID